MMMMNGVILHHSRAGVLLPLLWFSLVALCDPYPSSDGRSSSIPVGLLQNSSEQAAGRSEHPSGSGINSSGFTDLYDKREAGTGTSTLKSSFQQHPNGTHSHIATTKQFLPLFGLSSPKIDSADNDREITDNKKGEAAVAVTITKADSFNGSTKNEEEKRRKSGVLRLTKLNPESLTKSGTHHHPKLSLRLDRDYTPSEIADYIWRTGDERGFSQAVGEMVQDGELMMMQSKDDVIVFLEMVKQKLSKLRRKGVERDPSAAH